MVRLAPLLLFASATAWAQEPKRVLLEVYTGAWCQFCTDVDWRVDALKETWGDRLIVAYDHNGDAMDFSPSPEEEVGVGGYPQASIDRGVAESRSDWVALVAARMALAPGASLELIQHYTPEARYLDLKATVTFEQAAAAGTMLRLELVEDGLTGTGTNWDQLNYYDTISGHAAFGLGNPIVGYVHDRVLRMTPLAMNDQGVIAAGAVVDQVESRYWHITLPAGWDPANMSVVLFLIDQAASPANRRIWTVLDAPLGAEAAITLSGTTDDDELDFGGVRLGEYAEITLTVTNSGTAPLVFGAQGDLSQAAFTIVADDCSEATHLPGEDCEITVRFEPAALGEVSDDLTLPYEAWNGAELSVHLDGLGAGPPEFSLAGAGGTTEDPAIDFAKVRIGLAATATVVVTNTGDVPLVFGARDVLAAPFSVTADTCSAQSHPVDTTCQVTVRYAPTASEAGSGVLRIPLDPVADGVIEVDLAGRGNGAPVAVDDAYTVVAGEELEVDAPGVLANDNDPESDTILPSIVDGVDGMGMAYDGSFSMPTALTDAGTTITFTYALQDLLGSGAPATVTVTVTAPDDGGDSGNEGDDVHGACGCGTVTPGTGASAFAGLLGMILRRRARRVGREV